MEEPLPLTPEQQLVASIQDTIDGITNKYSKGLIMGVTADFTGHYLTVAVGPAWYQLRERSQNRLAQDLYEQALTFDFQRLDILDSLGLPVARNPVVGKKMVILRRAIATEGY